MRKTDIEIANEDIKEFQDDLFTAHKKIDKLEVENVKLKTKLELAMSQNYCTMCGNILDGYVPPKKNWRERMRSCPYNFKTCARENCDYWRMDGYGCGLFSGIKSFDDLEKKLQNLNDTENLIMKTKEP